LQKYEITLKMQDQIPTLTQNYKANFKIVFEPTR
jgi:hypothetical protein